MTEIERELLLTAVRATPDEPAAARARVLLDQHADSLEWGYLIDQADRHAVLALLGVRLDELWPKSPGAPKMAHRKLFRRHRQMTRLRNEALTRELETVLRAFHAAGVSVALRKGSVLGRDLYRDLGVREMSDIDLLVRRSDFDPARDALVKLGYIDGDASPDGRVITPNSRAFQIYWAIHGNGFHFCRTTSEPFVEVYKFELTDNLFAPDSGSSVSVDQLLPHFQPYELNGVPTHRLSDCAFLLDLCSDIYLKATTLYFIEQSRDLRLRKFVDLLGLVSGHHTAEFAAQLHALATSLGVLDHVAFSLHLAAELYGAEYFSAFLDLFPEPAAGLRGYGTADGIEGTWSAPAGERIFDTRRHTQAPASRTPKQATA